MSVSNLSTIIFYDCLSTYFICLRLSYLSRMQGYNSCCVLMETSDDKRDLHCFERNNQVKETHYCLDLNDKERKFGSHLILDPETSCVRDGTCGLL